MLISDYNSLFVFDLEDGFWYMVFSGKLLFLGREKLVIVNDVIFFLFFIFD